MIVDRVRSCELDATVVRAARVRWNGGELDLRIEVPAGLASPSADGSAFLAATLQLAMRRGEDLEIDAPVSPRLLRQCEQIQALYASWNPALRRCGVRVADEAPLERRGTAIASFFSRGADSTFCAAADRQPPLTLLVFADGLEPRHDERVRSEEVRLAGEAARRIGLPLVTASTNLRELVDPLVDDWEDYVAPGLAFLAHSLAGGLQRAVVASTDSHATLEPCGTGPVLDPLFSTEAVEIEHGSMAKGHAGKVGWLAANRPDLLRWLKVCFMENRPDNCGRCSKCLITMAELQAAGALSLAWGFPDRIDLTEVANTPLLVRKGRRDWIEVASLLDEHPALERAIRGALARGERELESSRRSARQQPRSFRQHHMRRLLALVEDEPAVGLVRVIDRDRGHHVYRAGRIGEGELVGELGSLTADAPNGSLAAWIGPDGRFATADYEPSIGPRPARLAIARWVLAPLAWRGLPGPGSRLFAVARRALRRRERGSGHVSRSGAPSGFLHAEDGPERLALYSAVHPITGDQLLTTWRWEAVDLGYEGLTQLGYLALRAPLTGRVGTDSPHPHLPWASRFGQRIRLAA